MNKPAFTSGEDIIVTFSRRSGATTKDWIGVYPTSVARPDGNAVINLRLYVCDSDTACGSPVPSGTLTFGSATPGGTWPLAAGTYNAWYMHNDGYTPVSTTPSSPVAFAVVAGAHCIQRGGGGLWWAVHLVWEIFAFRFGRQNSPAKSGGFLLCPPTPLCFACSISHALFLYSAKFPTPKFATAKLTGHQNPPPSSASSSEFINGRVPYLPPMSSHGVVMTKRKRTLLMRGCAHSTPALPPGGGVLSMGRWPGMDLWTGTARGSQGAAEGALVRGSQGMGGGGGKRGRPAAEQPGWQVTTSVVPLTPDASLPPPPPP